MRQNCGSRLFRFGLVAGLLALFAGIDTASAGALPNSVRVGDRSKMHIVGLPEPGEKRIVVRPAALNRPARATPQVAAPSALDWFWTPDGPAAAARGAGRWHHAIATLRERRRAGAGLVSGGVIEQIVARHGLSIARAASEAGISPALVAAVIAVESRGQAQAVSPKGAQGLMQLIPATARRFGVANSFDPEANIRGGAAYLDWLLDRFDGDILLALAGYNAGEGAVDKHGGVPPYRETRDYVVKVLDALAAAEGMCPAILDGPRQPCPFRMAEN